jgi:hypothetical protein
VSWGIQHPQRNATLSECSLLRYLYLAHFSQPAACRRLYRGLRAWKSRTLVELGIGNGLRTRRLLEVAKRYAAAPIRYTGIDLFEARPASQPGLTLKQAYRQLHLPGVRLQLVPGDPWSALDRVANTLQGTDLLLVAADQEPHSLARAWFYVPRMLHDQSRVLVEKHDAAGAGGYEEIALAVIPALSAAARPQRRAA